MVKIVRLEATRRLDPVEVRARRIVVGHDPEQSGLGEPRSIVEARIARTVRELDSARDLHEGTRRSLLRQECFIDTELMHVEQRTPKYSPYRFPEREKLQRRLFQLERERRDRGIAHWERVQRLRSELIELLIHHEAVNDEGIDKPQPTLYGRPAKSVESSYRSMNSSMNGYRTPPRKTRTPSS